MFESLFDLPLATTGPGIIGPLCLFAIGELLVVRLRILPRLRKPRSQDSDNRKTTLPLPI